MNIHRRSSRPLNDHEKIKWTEQMIQTAIYYERVQSQDTLMPNIYYANWEADMIAITKAGLVTEFEVKVTVADFRADKLKIEKHICLQNTFATKRPADMPRLMTGWAREALVPNRFVYAMPEEVAAKVIDEIPPYAGLLIVKQERPPYSTIEEAGIQLRTEWARLPKQLHREKITDSKMRNVGENAAERYCQKLLNVKYGNSNTVTVRAEV